MWKLHNYDEPRKKIEDHDGRVTDLVFSKDGRFLASACTDKKVRLWNVWNTNEKPRVIGTHGDRVNCVAFSPDGSILASCGDDKTVKLFKLQDPVFQTASIEGHEAPVLSVAFSPDGKKLISADDNGRIYVWITQTEELSDMVCRQVFQDLSENEWRDFVSKDLDYKKTCEKLRIKKDL